MGRVARGIGVVAIAVAGTGCAQDGLFGSGGETEGGGSSPQIPGGDYCGDVENWDSALVEAEEEVLVLVNEARASGGICGSTSKPPVPPLRMSGPLRCAARVHSKDMNDREFFDHNNPDGESPFDRMERAGYDYWAAGENIAYNYPTPRDVVTGWLESPGHCGNIMSVDFTEIGVGYYAEGGAGHMWTQTFGDPM